ncbi:transcription factor bHLH121 [Cocos nucifera]|uniref:Transcription factor bHLH121 n=1 Tax=Cocos nucifera TaxID=13894 RepID=A0A8K0N4B8_COCNU|nr:transcription factor bHLH121 [Cocos nucifera]
MDQWKPSEGFFPDPAQAELPDNGFHRASDDLCQPPGRLPDPSQRVDQDFKDSIAARKVQKADREKLRRDRLNEQFLELGNVLDPDRPKNDKATILADTIQMLKELTAQVNRLKAEYASFSEESRELTQEKNELREEKAALKSEIDNLNAQYQQRLRVLYPWAAMDPSVIMGPPPAYPFPMPVPIPSGPIPIHTSLQPYPFFRNQNPGTIPSSCSTYGPYAHPCNVQVEQPTTQCIPPHPHPSGNKSHGGSRQDSRSKSSDRQQRSCGERSDDISDVATELELKTPGSAVPSSHSKEANDQDLSSEVRKGKQWPLERKGSGCSDGSSSSRCSSCGGVPASSSNSVGDSSVAKN